MSVLHRKCRSRDGKPSTPATNSSPSTMPPPPSRARQLHPRPRHKILSRRLTRLVYLYMWKAGGEEGGKEEGLEEIKYMKKIEKKECSERHKGHAETNAEMKTARKEESRKTIKKRQRNTREQLERQTRTSSAGDDKIAAARDQTASSGEKIIPAAPHVVSDTSNTREPI